VAHANGAAGRMNLVPVEVSKNGEFLSLFANLAPAP
jgi:hypothetical protein